MVSYCTNISDCRRQAFSEAFGVSEDSLTSSHRSSSRNSFQRCGHMCDNCLSRGPRSSEGGSVSKAEARHIYHPENRTRERASVAPQGEWTDRKSMMANGGNGMTCFQTASGKRVQPSIIHLDEEKQSEHETNSKKRKIESTNDDGATEDDWLTKSDSRSTHRRHSSSSIGGQLSSSRGMAMFHSAKDAIIQSAKTFVSNRTTNPSRVVSRRGSGGGGRMEDLEEVQLIE